MHARTTRPGFRAPGYGRGQHSIGGDALLQADPREMARRLLQTFRDGRWNAPRLPEVAAEIMRIAGRPNTEFSDMVALLSQDQMLAAKVLTTTQSPMYARRNVPKTLDDAVARLGLRGLRNVVIETSMSLRVFRGAAYRECLASIQRHCRAVAHLSHLVARRAQIDHDEAFLGGLLHDVGMAAGVLVVGDALGRREPPPLERYWYAIEAAHTEGGAALCRLWGMPDGLVEVVAHHHRAPERPEERLPAAVMVAEHLAIGLGFGVAAPETDLRVPTEADERTSPQKVSKAVRLLGIDRRTYLALRQEAEGLLQLLD